jgi:hypothetical protein
MEDVHRGRSNRRSQPNRARDDGSPNRDFGRLASSRDSRGPDTGGPMEREVYPPGSVNRQGYGSRSRSMESRQRPGPQRDTQGEDFDDDLVR